MASFFLLQQLPSFIFSNNGFIVLFFSLIDSFYDLICLVVKRKLFIIFLRLKAAK